MKKIYLPLVTSVLFFWIFTINVSAQVVISEVLPNPESSFAKSEWIELYNLGSSAVDLTGWSIAGKVLPVGSTIAAGDFLLVTKDLPEFTSHFGVTDSRVLQLAISLTNSGGTVQLQNPAKQILDTFTYGNSTNLRDISWERSSNLITTPISHCFGDSLLQLNGHWTVADDTVCPQIQYSIDGNNWSATLDTVGRKTVQLKLVNNTGLEFGHWRVNNEDLDSPIQSIDLYNFLGSDVLSVNTFRGRELSIKSNQLNVWPNLLINEVNRSQDTGWVEIYNANNFTINLSNWQIDCTGITTLSNISIQSQSYVVADLPVNCLNSMPLSLKLLTPTGMVVDSASFSNEQAAWNWSRDIGGNWTTTYPNSKGAENKPASPATLQFSEVYPSPGDGEQEWIELYNYGDSVVDLTDWTIADLSSSMSLTGSVQPRSFIVVSNLVISLNNSGDTLELRKGSQVHDQWVYTSVASGTALDRTLVNGEYGLPVFQTKSPTPAEHNQLPQVVVPITIAAAKLHEIESEVKVGGVITADLNAFVDTELYMQDATAGIKIDFSNALSLPELKRGQQLTLTGKLRESGGELKIYVDKLDSLEAKAAAEPAPKQLAVLADIDFGRLVQVKGKVNKVYSTSFDLVTTYGTVRVSKQKSPELVVKVDMEVSAIGILTSSDELYRLLPRSVDDITLAISAQSPIPAKSLAEAVGEKQQVYLPMVSLSNPQVNSVKLVTNYSMPVMIPVWQLASGLFGIASISYALWNYRHYLN